jgi:hypothetical protein
MLRQVANIRERMRVLSKIVAVLDMQLGMKGVD